jgi:hypothetical protein
MVETQILSVEKKTEFSSKLNICKYILPCSLKKGRLERKGSDYLKKIQMPKNKFFSFENIIKTIRNIKLMKNLIFNHEQKYFFRYSDLYDLNNKKLFFKNSLKFEENEINLNGKLKIFKNKTYKTIKDEAKNGINS